MAPPEAPAAIRWPFFSRRSSPRMQEAGPTAGTSTSKPPRRCKPSSPGAPPPAACARSRAALRQRPAPAAAPRRPPPAPALAPWPPAARAAAPPPLQGPWPVVSRGAGSDRSTPGCHAAGRACCTAARMRSSGRLAASRTHLLRGAPRRHGGCGCGWPERQRALLLAGPHRLLLRRAGRGRGWPCSHDRGWKGRPGRRRHRPGPHQQLAWLGPAVQDGVAELVGLHRRGGASQGEAGDLRRAN
jgi:hypothetical protein